MTSHEALKTARFGWLIYATPPASLRSRHHPCAMLFAAALTTAPVSYTGSTYKRAHLI